MVKMVSSTLERELREHLERLPEPRQREVVEYARGLAAEKPKGVSGKEFLELTGTIEPDDIALMKQAKPKGVPGKDLLKFAGTIEPDDLELMKQAIEEECERVDLDEW